MALALLLALALLPRAAGAHGGESRLVLQGAPVGDWALSAWLAPAELRPGDVHLSLRIDDAGRPVTDCQVTVQARPLDGASPALETAAGPATAATDFQHEAALRLREDGRYRFTITVTAPDGLRAVHSFDAVVQPVNRLISALIIAQLALAPLLGLWLLREGVTMARRRRAKPI